MSLLAPFRSLHGRGQTAVLTLRFATQEITQGGICIFNSFSYENSQTESIGVLELVPEGAREGSSPVFAPLKRSVLTGEILGALATLCLTQIYSYTREQCDRVLEARYRFPLPGDSAVTGVRVTFGDTEITTVLKDRQAAKEDYKAAKSEGRQAVLLTRESPDVFTLCIAGLQPGEDVRIETSYLQVAKPEGLGWSLRVPLTTVPRYVRKDEFSSRHAGGQPLAVLRDPGHRFGLDLLVKAAAAAESPTHKLKVAREEAGLRVRLQQDEVLPDRDFVLSWVLPQDSARPTLRAEVCRDGDDAYFLALIMPPATGAVRTVQRECVILVDHSGSMEGSKWEAADWAVEKFLLGMAPGDRFALGVFHDSTAWHSRSPLEATEANVRSAIEFLHSRKESGGTELGVALEQALDQKRVPGDLSRHVLIVTDAEVSDEGRILRLAKEESRRGDRRRISILCIDAAPNSFLAHQLAEKGGGVARFLTSSPEEGDISTALDAILDDWSQPIAANCTLAVSGTAVQAVGYPAAQKAGWGHVDLGDLTASRARWVSGKVTGAGLPEFKLLDSAGRTLGACTGEEGRSKAIKALTGARKIAELEFLIHSRLAGDDLRAELRAIGYEPEAVFNGRQSRLYPENNQIKEAEMLRGLIVSESLKYGLASSETSFVAVSSTAGKKVEGTAVVANALAAGWSEGFCSQPGCNVPAPVAAAPMGRAVKKAVAPAAESVAQDEICKQDVCAPAPQPRARPSPKKQGGIADVLDSSIHRLTGKIQRQATGTSTPSTPPAEPQAGMPARAVVFEGKPRFAAGEAVLYDSLQDGKALAGAFQVKQLCVEFPAGAPEAGKIGGIRILIYLDDLSTPRATVKLADLLRQRGMRPLNLALGQGSRVRIVLAGADASQGFELPLKVSLGLQ